MAMKLELKKKKIEGQTVWEWWVKEGRKIIAGGMCSTKADAANDAKIWMDDETTRRKQANNQAHRSAPEADVERNKTKGKSNEQ